jgi:hypothetical protein
MPEYSAAIAEGAFAATSATSLTIAFFASSVSLTT